jgi:hypothetical protein
MFVNVMTKPVQGQQFIRERNALTNWFWIINFGIQFYHLVFIIAQSDYVYVLGVCWNNTIQVCDSVLMSIYSTLIIVYSDTLYVTA